MATTTELAQSALHQHLQPGEAVLAASRAQLEGGTMRLANRTGIAVGLGLPAGVAIAGPVGSTDDNLEAQFANGVVIAVTANRVVLLDVTAVSVKPRDPVLFIDRRAVVGVETGEKRVMLVKMTTIGLTLGGDEPRELGFEIPKVARRDGESVVAALAR